MTETEALARAQGIRRYVAQYFCVHKTESQWFYLDETLRSLIADAIRKESERAEAAETEGVRLRELLNFQRHFIGDHKPSYAAMCLNEGEISLGKFCEFMRALAAGNDTDLRSQGFTYAAAGGKR